MEREGVNGVDICSCFTEICFGVFSVALEGEVARSLCVVNVLVEVTSPNVHQ